MSKGQVTTVSTTARRKLIEVALPLEAINRESARDNATLTGHPRNIHYWWAWRKLPACRAVLFAQLVDDPSANPDRFPDEEAQATERQRLFDLIERIVVWENVGDERLMRQAYDEIAACFDGKPPAILDPFAGGGSIPLEAQRLGLEAHASDLNPVAVLINKALIEIPPKYAGQSPVFPGAANERLGDWSRAIGLGEDVRRYGGWVRDEAEKRIGHLYPKAQLPGGGEATVIAWIWARTVSCPNPACGATMPLVRSFWLSKNKNRPTWLRPVVQRKSVTFDVVVDRNGPPIEGTVGRQGSTCLVCETPVPLKHVRAEGKAGRMGQQLMTLVVEGQRQRVYLPASAEHVVAAHTDCPAGVPEADLPHNPRDFKTPNYGMTRFADLFTNRQLVALTTFSDLVTEARAKIELDAHAARISNPTAYANAVATYIAFVLDRATDNWSNVCTWHSGNGQMRNVFARQAIPMTWDFAEANRFSGEAVGWTSLLSRYPPAIGRLGFGQDGIASQQNAVVASVEPRVICTDPPYYNNVGYSDLSDFFYVWLRRSLQDIFPELLGTLLTPKADELIATPYRFEGNRKRAEEHFESGFIETFTRVRKAQPVGVPATIFYAFKQSEDDEAGSASTGWETMLNGLTEAGLRVTATWPIRTERATRMLASGTNALASSIVLACRPREVAAQATTRRGFLQALRAELPRSLREMQQGSIAPVDLAQAAIGPGMAVFTRYRNVLEADGSTMTVRTALALINHALDEVLSELEGDFDADTRFCVKWYSQFGWEEQPFGRADDLSRSTNTSVDGLVRRGVFWARAGRARLVPLEELSADWDPMADERVSVWEVVARLAHALNTAGGEEAARLMAAASQRVDIDNAKELAYLLFRTSEKQGWTQSAVLFNGLGTSWSDLSAASRGAARAPAPAQEYLDFDRPDELDES